MLEIFVNKRFQKNILIVLTFPCLEINFAEDRLPYNFL